MDLIEALAQSQPISTVLVVERHGRYYDNDKLLELYNVANDVKEFKKIVREVYPDISDAYALKIYHKIDNNERAQLIVPNKQRIQHERLGFSRKYNVTPKPGKSPKPITVRNVETGVINIVTDVPLRTNENRIGQRVWVDGQNFIMCNGIKKYAIVNITILKQMCGEASNCSSYFGKVWAAFGINAMTPKQLRETWNYFKRQQHEEI